MIIIGILSILNALTGIIAQAWLESFIPVLICVIWAIVMCNNKNMLARKALWIVYLIAQSLQFILVVLVLIFFAILGIGDQDLRLACAEQAE